MDERAVTLQQVVAFRRDGFVVVPGLLGDEELARLAAVVDEAVGLRKFQNIFFADDPRKLLDEPALRGIEPTWVEVPRGGVAFHHGLTVHLARPNRSPRTRRVHTMIYFRDGSTRGTKAPHFAVDRMGIGAGERIESALTPIAWPRAVGDWPEPPPLLERDIALGTLPSRETAA